MERRMTMSGRGEPPVQTSWGPVWRSLHTPQVCRRCPCKTCWWKRRRQICRSKSTNSMPLHHRVHGELSRLAGAPTESPLGGIILSLSPLTKRLSLQTRKDGDNTPPPYGAWQTPMLPFYQSKPAGVSVHWPHPRFFRGIFSVEIKAGLEVCLLH